MTKVESFLTFTKCFLNSDVVVMFVMGVTKSGKKVFEKVDLTKNIDLTELVNMWENHRKLGFFWDLK